MKDTEVRYNVKYIVASGKGKEQCDQRHYRKCNSSGTVWPKTLFKCNRSGPVWLKAVAKLIDTVWPKPLLQV